MSACRMMRSQPEVMVGRVSGTKPVRVSFAARPSVAGPLRRRARPDAVEPISGPALHGPHRGRRNLVRCLDKVLQPTVSPLRGLSAAELGRQAPDGRMSARVEEEYAAVLFGIETAVVSVVSEAPDLVDKNVLAAVDALLALYSTEIRRGCDGVVQHRRDDQAWCMSGVCLRASGSSAAGTSGRLLSVGAGATRQS